MASFCQKKKKIFVLKATKQAACSRFFEEKFGSIGEITMNEMPYMCFKHISSQNLLILRKLDHFFVR